MSRKNDETLEKNPRGSFADFQGIDEGSDIFQQMFRHSVIPTIIHDMKMKIIDVNESALTQFGYTKDEFFLKSIFDLHPKEELEHSDQVLKEMRSQERLSVETAFVRKYGSIFFAQATLCKFMVGNQPLIHVFIQDITAQKLAENQLRAYNKQLQDKNMELEQFAYIAAHDLKAPLRSVISFSEVLNEELEALKLDSEKNKNLTYFGQRIKKIL